MLLSYQSVWVSLLCHQQYFPLGIGKVAFNRRHHARAVVHEGTVCTLCHNRRYAYSATPTLPQHPSKLPGARHAYSYQVNEVPRLSSNICVHDLNLSTALALQHFSHHRHLLTDYTILPENASLEQASGSILPAS